MDPKTKKTRSSRRKQWFSKIFSDECGRVRLEVVITKFVNKHGLKPGEILLIDLGGCHERKILGVYYAHEELK